MAGRGVSRGTVGPVFHVKHLPCRSTIGVRPAGRRTRPRWAAGWRSEGEGRGVRSRHKRPPLRGGRPVVGPASAGGTFWRRVHPGAGGRPIHYYGPTPSWTRELVLGLRRPSGQRELLYGKLFHVKHRAGACVRSPQAAGCSRDAAGRRCCRSRTKHLRATACGAGRRPAPGGSGCQCVGGVAVGGPSVARAVCGRRRPPRPLAFRHPYDGGQAAGPCDRGGRGPRARRLRRASEYSAGRRDGPASGRRPADISFSDHHGHRHRGSGHSPSAPDRTSIRTPRRRPHRL